MNGCAAIQNPPSSEIEPQKSEKIIQSEKTIPLEKTIKLPPMISGGKKPLLAEERMDRVNFPSEPKDEIGPCIDPKTRKAKNFLLADLKSELIPLSYTNMDQILSSLQVMGLKTIEATGPVASPYTVDKRGRATMLPKPKLTHDKIGYTCSELPVFYKPKLAPVKSLTEVMAGPTAYATGSRFSMVNLNAANYGLNESMIVFYHPSGKKRLNNIKNTILKTLDAAPLQIYIESMVLEVNESGLEELGVLYKANVPGGVNQTFELGKLEASSPSTAGASKLFKTALEKGIGAASVSQLLSISLEALIAKGSAEVLSRPSVITLNNRPAVIEVTEQKQFPIVAGYKDRSGNVQNTYTFEEVTPGILLQIRPRVSETKNEVAMEIDVQVKALVSANDGVAKDAATNNTVSTKPGSSTRRVHTFAMVPNKTPMIIGGLVSKEREDTTNKIPLLADIPYLGRLFGAESSSNNKKEVIVVITPHIIRNNKDIGIQSPKDTAMFDDTDMDLFRDTYRVRSEDVFDLGFVYQSKQFSKYRNYVVSRSAKDETFAKTPLAKSYSGAQFPGGNALVTRMIYDIVGKRNLAKPVSRDNILMTKHEGDGNFKKVTFLEKEWKKAQSKNYGLQLKFSGKETNPSVQPHVAIRMLSLEEIEFLSETNKHKKDSSQIFISSEKDLKKIRRAIVVREIQKLNRNKHIFGHLNEFGNGTKLTLPVIKKTRYFLLDEEVATVYHQIKFYYQILEESLKESFILVENEIKKVELNERKAEELRKVEQRRTQTQQRQMQQRQMQQRPAQPRTQAATPTQPSKLPTNGRKGMTR
jgi:general secretion pathway protein D